METKAENFNLKLATLNAISCFILQNLESVLFKDKLQIEVAQNMIGLHSRLSLNQNRRTPESIKWWKNDEKLAKIRQASRKALNHLNHLSNEELFNVIRISRFVNDSCRDLCSTIPATLIIKINSLYFPISEFPAHDITKHNLEGNMLNIASDENNLTADNLFDNFSYQDEDIDETINNANILKLKDFVANTGLLNKLVKESPKLKEEVAEKYQEKTGENDESDEKEKWIKKYIKTLPQRILAKEQDFTQSEIQIIKEMFLYENRMQVFRYFLALFGNEYNLTKIKMASGEIFVDSTKLAQLEEEVKYKNALLNKMFRERPDTFDTHEEFAKRYGVSISKFEGDVIKRNKEFAQAIEELFLNPDFKAKVYAELGQELE